MIFVRQKIVTLMLCATGLSAWAGTAWSDTSDSSALAQIQAVNAQDGAALQQRIQQINQQYGTAQTFSSSAMNAGQQVGDAAAQAAGAQYGTAAQQSMAGAANHREGDESQAVAPAAQSAGTSLNGPIASHEAAGNAYEQDASNAENYVCSSTNSAGQCTAGYWNCDSACQSYRALAQRQFALASEDSGQQSAMDGQTSQLQAQGAQQQQQHTTLNNEAQTNATGAYNTNLAGSEAAGALEQQGQAQIVQQAQSGIDQEPANILASMGVPGENQPYTLPAIPTLSAGALTASAQSQVNQLQTQATQLADTAMSETQAAAEAYRQWQAYLQAEQQAQAQARQDEANAASAPTPESRAAWASAAAAMQSEAQSDAQKAAAQQAIYQQQRQLAQANTEQSESVASEEAQVADGAVENAASQQIAPYLDGAN